MFHAKGPHPVVETSHFNAKVRARYIKVYHSIVDQTVRRAVHTNLVSILTAPLSQSSLSTTKKPICSQLD